MTTDLKAVFDHPATAIRVLAVEMYAEFAGQAQYDQAKVTDGIDTIMSVATFLNDLEEEKGFTFAALDNEALQAVYSAWDDDNYTDLALAVGDLLGIE